MPPSVKIQLLGPMCVQIEGNVLPPLRSRKGQWLLALLTLRHGHEIGRDWLAGTLWPDSSESQAFASLRQTLADLRHGLGEAAAYLQAPTNRTLRLALPSPEAAIDVLAFDAAITRGDRTSLERAVQLYSGPLLEGCTEDWILPERTAREQALLTALETLGEQCAAQHNLAQAQHYLRQVIARDPYRETAQRTLMQVLAETGNFADVMVAYRNLRLYLRQELNAEPDPETTALYQKLRRVASRKAQEAPGPVPEPEAVVLSVALPQPLTRLVGRKQEIAEIQDCLHSTRLLTLTGSGGVGKTRLALMVAENVAAEYPDGVCFVDLSPLTEPALVAQTVASTLGLREQPGRPAQVMLREHLRAKSMLLVLDNCEHLIYACVEMVEALLQDCLELKILATSREALNVPGETPWHVPSLACPTQEELLTRGKDRPDLLLQNDAARLFLDRATVQRPDLALTAETAHAVAQICYRLDGIPFALELAAARVKVLSVEQIAVRLDDCFRLLTGGSRTALPRQQTLRALIDWSYNLLSEAERLLLGRLAIFLGGWTLDAAEAICSGQGLAVDEVLDLIGTLVDKSLIVSEDRAHETRYRLLETVRQYSLERLEATQEEEIVRRKHLEFFLALAEEAEPELKKAEQRVWMARLKREHDNFRGALSWCQRKPENVEAGLRMASALAPYWGMSGDISEGRATLTALLALSDAAAMVEVRAKALNAVGALVCYQGEYGAATDAFAESLRIRKALKDTRGVAALLNNMGVVAVFQGHYNEGRAFLEECIELYRGLGEPLGIANTLLNLGNVANEQGDYAAARPVYEEALAIWRAGGVQKGMAYALLNLGNVARGEGDHAEAHRLYAESLAFLEQLGDKRSLATLAQCQAELAYRENDFVMARVMALECMERLYEVGEKHVMARNLELIAYLALIEGQVTRAARILGAAEGLRETLHVPLPPAEQETYTMNLDQVRARLEPERLRAAWASGKSLSLDQVIRYATERE